MGKTTTLPLPYHTIPYYERINRTDHNRNNSAHSLATKLLLSPLFFFGITRNI